MAKTTVVRIEPDALAIIGKYAGSTISEKVRMMESKIGVAIPSPVSPDNWYPGMKGVLQLVTPSLQNVTPEDWALFEAHVKKAIGKNTVELKPVFTPASKIADEEKYIEPVGRQGREVR